MILSQTRRSVRWYDTMGCSLSTQPSNNSIPFNSAHNKSIVGSWKCKAACEFERELIEVSGLGLVTTDKDALVSDVDDDERG
jgi:hypothetical protein